MKRTTLLLVFTTFLVVNSYAQCFILSGDSPAFEINIPEGVQIDSAFLFISNYDASEYVRSRGRSFNNFEHTSWFDEDGTYPILNSMLAGSTTADFQVHASLDEICGKLFDYVKFDWSIEFYCSGLDGDILHYSGSLNDNLAIPTNIGSVYAGLNTVSGSIDVILEGKGYLLYPDYDYDGFGDMHADPVLLCNNWCPMYVDNNLDCDDLNPNVNPDAEEIPNNGIDENCDGMDLVTSTNELANTAIKIYPNPAKDIINIDIIGILNFKASIYNLEGKLIKRFYNESKLIFDSPSTGTYLLEIEDLLSGQRFFEKIVVLN
ncbi:MAG: MopE-related protein [Cyclobacteriaceae bacterium]